LRRDFLHRLFVGNTLFCHGSGDQPFQEPIELAAIAKDRLVWNLGLPSSYPYP
jgi:hypothetical protein